MKIVIMSSLWLYTGRDLFSESERVRQKRIVGRTQLTAALLQGDSESVDRRRADDYIDKNRRAVRHKRTFGTVVPSICAASIRRSRDYCG